MLKQKGRENEGLANKNGVYLPHGGEADALSSSNYLAHLARKQHRSCQFV
jgi:hypothetical protein